MTSPVLPRFGAVSFLNSVPLVWGMLRGPQQAAVDLSFSLPSECASQFATGLLDAGLLPVAEIVRQGLQIVPGVGVSCLGPVRSILLFSKVPWQSIQSLAADSSSRTSVELALVILREQFGVRPALHRQKPNLPSMLENADSALIIGDPALHIDPATAPYQCLDLGAEWLKLTSLPMVFAAWACRPDTSLVNRIADITQPSHEFGEQHLHTIIDEAAQERKLPFALVNTYLRQNIRYRLHGNETAGLTEFIRLSGLRARKAA